MSQRSRDGAHIPVIAYAPGQKAVTVDAAARGICSQYGRMNQQRLLKNTMWLPAPLYEALPYLYVLGGVMFIAGTMYIGTSAPGASLYIGCGLISIVYGAYIFKLRSDARRNQSFTETMARD